MWRLQPNMAAQTLGGAMAMESGGLPEPEPLAQSSPPPRRRKKKKAHGRRS